MAPAVETTRAAGMEISVDTTRCKSCEICVAECPTDVFEMRGAGPNSRPVPTDPGACLDCSTCERLCPDVALEVGPR
ncbi:MAG: ferredoxin family protein [Halanaeroarchaeum sp.]